MALRLFLQSLRDKQTQTYPETIRSCKWREKYTDINDKSNDTGDKSQRIEQRTRELYPLSPGDFAEANRLHFQHYLIRMVMQHHYLAPLQKPGSILDVGCGHSPWAQEIARIHPQTKVFGVDNFPLISETALFPPKNYRFLQGDIREELPFPDQTFDLAHQQFLLLATPLHYWEHILEELVRVTRPGGWIEIVDTDLLIHHAGSATQQMMTWQLKACAHYGIDPRKYSSLNRLLEKEDIVDLHMETIKVPIGQWGGRIGRLAMADFLALCSELKLLIMTLTNISAEEYDQTALAMQREWDFNMCFCTFAIFYAQRAPL